MRRWSLIALLLFSAVMYSLVHHDFADTMMLSLIGCIPLLILYLHEKRSLDLGRKYFVLGWVGFLLVCLGLITGYSSAEILSLFFNFRTF